MVISKLISSLDKCFYDSKLTDFQPLRRISGFQGQQVSMQLVYCDNEVGNPYPFRLLNVAVEGDLAPLVRLRRVESVPVTIAAYEGRCDGDYLRTTPGLYPDLLLPLSYEGRVAVLPAAQLRSLWIDVDLCEEVSVGDHTLTIGLLDSLAATLCYMVIFAFGLPRRMAESIGGTRTLLGTGRVWSLAMITMFFLPRANSCKEGAPIGF